MKKFSLILVLILNLSCGNVSQINNSPNPLIGSNVPLTIVNQNNNINIPKGNVTGKIVDYTTKLGVPGVKVQVKAVKPDIVALTDSSGKYILKNVPKGRQFLEVTKQNYTKLNTSNIVVDVKENTTNLAQDILIILDNASKSNAFVKVIEGLKFPRGITVDRNTNDIYVVDVIGAGGIFSFDRAEVKKITPEGSILTSFGSRILDSDLINVDLLRLLKNSNGIGTDGGGNIFVADTGNNSVKKYGPNGRYLSTIQKNFINPFDVAVMTTGDVVVSDPGNGRVVILDSSMNIRIENILGQNRSDGIKGITTDISDNIYVIDTSGKPGEIIKKFDKNGMQLNLKFGYIGGIQPGYFSNPTDIAIDNLTGDIYITDSGNNRIQRFNADGIYIGEFGQFGIEAGSFNEPTGIAIDSQGFIYVSDTKNRRIQKFSPGRVIVNQ